MMQIEQYNKFGYVMPDNELLQQRVLKAFEIASKPAPYHVAQSSLKDIDLEAWQYIGDPLAEALILELRVHNMMSRDIYGAARLLQEKGNLAANNFFADVEFVPEWADFEQMRLGAKMGLRNPIGLFFGLHGALPYTYTYPNVAKVMASTGRLDKKGDFPRRFWETATGFIGAFDVDGMKPLGKGWQVWVRIRLMHTMVRMGVLKSGRWKSDWANPIDQLTTAGGVYAFGQYRVNIVKALGGRVSDAEADSYNLMWRWITRVLGVVPELLGQTNEEQQALDKLIHEYSYTVNTGSVELTQAMINGLSEIPYFLLPRDLHAAIVKYLLSPQYTLPAGKNLAHDLQITPSVWAKILAQPIIGSLKISSKATQLPLVRNVIERYGQATLEAFIHKQLGENKADYRTKN